VFGFEPMTYGSESECALHHIVGLVTRRCQILLQSCYNSYLCPTLLSSFGLQIAHTSSFTTIVATKLELRNLEQAACDITNSECSLSTRNSVYLEEMTEIFIHRLRRGHTYLTYGQLRGESANKSLTNCQ